MGSVTKTDLVPNQSFTEISDVKMIPQKMEEDLPEAQEGPAKMSQWAKVQQNRNVFQQMSQLYPALFPMEIRFYLCAWIEEQRWNEIDENNPQFVAIAQKTLSEMLDLMRQRASGMTSQEFFIIKHKLEELVQKLDTIVKTNPLELIQIIKRVLLTEQQLIEQAEQSEQQQMNQDVPGVDQSGVGEEIMAEIQNLLLRTRMTENGLKDLQNKQESFILKFSDSQKMQVQLQNLQQQPLTIERTQQENLLKKERDQINDQLGSLARQLQGLRLELARKYEETIVSLQDLQKRILDNELITWKRRQQMAGNGLVLDASSLETLQQWCESLAELIWQNRHQIKQTNQLQQQLPMQLPEGQENLLQKLNDTITGLLSTLVTSTFIVEQQPPQVLKKDARFGAVVRLLVGGKLNVHMNPPQVKATIISENQAKDLLRNDMKARDDTSGDILNNSGTMEYQQSNGQLSISFKNMQLKKIKRADKKGSEAVTEEKFCILFQSEFSVGGNELVFKVWTLSLPVVVTVHGNQECNATATVLWDNAFAEAGRVPFNVPDAVEWAALAGVLSIKFQSWTGKGLSEMNLSYIASKLFGQRDPTTCQVSWSQFNKDPLPNRTFTFWEWFYTIQKLAREHLKDLWTDEAIIGFVSKNQAQDWLRSQPQGTFLLRFSDSEIGGITIAWTGENEVWNLAPFTSKDFQIRGIADRIKDLHSLVYLYPGKAKDSVFSKYYTNTTENVNADGYIRPTLKTTIPERYAPGNELEFAQPFSPDSNPGSVQATMLPAMESIEMLENLDLRDTDQMPDDIISEIELEQLLQVHQLS